MSNNEDSEEEIEIDDLLGEEKKKCPLGYEKCIGEECPYFHRVKKRCTYYDECKGPC